MFCSCTGEANIIGCNNNEQINFSISTPKWENTDSLSSPKTSRATPITDASLSLSNTFKLIADKNDGTGIYSTLIDKEPVSFTNNMWQTTTPHYWSGITNKTVNFYAYYPTSISGNISHTVGTAPTLSYIAPDDAVNQLDIMTATANNISGSTNISTPLTFNHIFAAVRFAVGNNGLPSGTIKSITISGIKNSGTYTFGSGWTLGSTISLFTVSPSTTITGANGENITSDAFTLMMIPQIFTNATITLTYTTGTSYKQTISGTWNAGNTYNYNLSKPVNIGDYYYSDGTWGTIAEHSNSTASPIGVIFSNSTSTIDKGHKWTHGYAMALRNASISTTWGPYGTDTPIPNVSSWEDIIKAKDGYSDTQLIKNAYGISQNSYPAFYFACSYNETVPTNSSGWYLPSIGLWYEIAINLGGIPPIYTNWRDAEPGWLGYSESCANSLNKYLNIQGISTDMFPNNNDWYWSTTEYTSQCVYRAYFFTPNFWLDGNDNDNHKDLIMRVRSVIAF